MCEYIDHSDFIANALVSQPKYTVVGGSMNETISAIDTITLRIPLDIWAPAPMSQGVPRTHVESL